MSEPREEATFDESVFDTADAGEKPAAEAKAAVAEKPEATQDTKPPPAARIETAARNGGWVPQDEWDGDPDEWVDAAEFILKGAGEVLPSMRVSLEKAQEDIKGLKSAVKASIRQVTKARQEGYEQRSRELQTELDAAAQAGNVADVRAITKDIVDLEKEVRGVDEDEAGDAPQGDHPDFAAWKETAPWFGKDAALTAAFNVICEAVREEGYATPKVGLKEAEKRLREEFPTKFAKPENPNRRLPGAVESGGQRGRAGGKSFSDMPKENQDACLDLMKLSKAITKENYAKEFFAGAAQ